MYMRNVAVLKLNIRISNIKHIFALYYQNLVFVNFVALSMVLLI